MFDKKSFVFKRKHAIISIAKTMDVPMSKGITTSIRLTPELRQQLDYLSHTLHRGKNWIVVQALQEFINRNNYTILLEEAKRQSLLASQCEINEEEEIWEENTDTTGWQS
jgi:predicted transcriptional regulator